jgi:hypothetical protein
MLSTSKHSNKIMASFCGDFLKCFEKYTFLWNSHRKPNLEIYKRFKQTWFCKQSTLFIDDI